MGDIAISVDAVSKKFHLGERQRYKALRDSLTRGLISPFRVAASLARGGVAPGSAAESRAGDFWALSDVSFNVRRGEAVGVIGRNGAGKSTLLKILSRIIEPTEGEVRLYGRVGSLLEVGTGFHPELTGRENIYLNGAILGMKRSEIGRKFDDIVAFAETERFLDTPVKLYSSGMYMRLAFAVAAFMDPEILVVDEVLAVGDAVFQKKCLGKMEDVAREGRTVLFVSHNMPAIRALCSRAILLDQGQLLFEDTVDACLERYAAEGRSLLGSVWERPSTALSPRGPVSVRRVSLEVRGEQPRHTLVVKALLESMSTHKPAFIAIDISDVAGGTIMQAEPTIHGFISDGQPAHRIETLIELPPLIPGQYLVSFWVGCHNTETYDWVQRCATFEIEGSPNSERTFPYSASHGHVIPPSTVRYAN